MTPLMGEDIPPTIVRKIADQIVNNSVALVDDDELLFAVEANAVWMFTLFLIHDSPFAADLDMTFAVPAGAELKFGSSHTERHDTPAATELNLNGQNTNCMAVIYGYIVNGAVAGNVQLQWAQAAAVVGDTTVRANSCIIARRIA